MKKTILILYYSRGTYPLRNTIKTHLYCWQAYSQHRVVYINTAFGIPKFLLNQLQIDLIIFHTKFLSLRWAPYLFEKHIKRILFLASKECPKIAFPQDEFIHTDILGNFFDKIGVTHIGTCAKQSEWEKIYQPLMTKGIELFTVLTGYLDRRTVKKILALPEVERDIDIGYRAWKAEYWLGEHGMHKVWIAGKFQEACQGRSLKIDISLRSEDTISGFKWFKFLKRCKVMIGVEGGASILDHDGKIRESVNSYLKHNPNASFNEVRDTCFTGLDHTFDIACISPRHLEACLTKTCQVLIEGEFNGILRAGIDYIPLKKDYSNLQEVLDLLGCSSFINKIADNAFNRVVKGPWYYDNFVREVEEKLEHLIQKSGQTKKDIFQYLLFFFLRLRDWLLWRYISLEAKVFSNQKLRLWVKTLLKR